jgi:hypothetical protein
LILGFHFRPIQADLDATIDAQLTDAIRAKSEELDNDPVKIYQWVRNNIRFIPGHGSIQVTNFTLSHGQGGTPNLALTSGGIIKQFEIEHIWMQVLNNTNTAKA